MPASVFSLIMIVLPPPSVTPAIDDRMFHGIRFVDPLRKRRLEEHHAQLLRVRHVRNPLRRPGKGNAPFERVGPPVPSPNV